MKKRLSIIAGLLAFTVLLIRVNNVRGKIYPVKKKYSVVCMARGTNLSGEEKKLRDSGAYHISWTPKENGRCYFRLQNISYNATQAGDILCVAPALARRVDWNGIKPANYPSYGSYNGKACYFRNGAYADLINKLKNRPPLSREDFGITKDDLAGSWQEVRDRLIEDLGE